MLNLYLSARRYFVISGCTDSLCKRMVVMVILAVVMIMMMAVVKIIMMLSLFLFD